jgi:hypothetical protein
VQPPIGWLSAHQTGRALAWPYPGGKHEPGSPRTKEKHL